VRSRYVEVGTGRRVHLLEMGAGPPVVLLHAPGTSAGLFLPLLNELKVVRALAPDRPGQGPSDPIGLPRDRYRETAVAWLDGLVDALKLDAAALLGNSGGAVWALWYALAHPDRVKQLVLLGPPAMPMTRLPLPVRLIATPGVGELLSRLAPPSRKSMLRFARFIGEGRPSPVTPIWSTCWWRWAGIRLRTGSPGQKFACSPRRSPCCRGPGGGVMHACDPTSCARWPCRRWWCGGSRRRSAAFRSRRLLGSPRPSRP
jgi:pimeloyl-ACP methyl ester carboxylesterase